MFFFKYLLVILYKFSENTKISNELMLWMNTDVELLPGVSTKTIKLTQTVETLRSGDVFLPHDELR